MTGLELIAAAGLSAGLAGTAGWGLRRLSRVRPDVRLDAGRALEVDLPPFAGVYPARFQSSNDQGAFGEALTLMIMAQEGWRPINGKPGRGPQGLDGVFWRREAGAWRARLIETKTNTSPYAPACMSDEKILRDLDQLYVTAGDPRLRAVYAAIAAAIRAGADRVDKQLWRHQLETGRTRVDGLGPDGEILAGRSVRSVSIETEALLAAVAELDRAGAILQPAAT